MPICAEESVGHAPPPEVSNGASWSPPSPSTPISCSPPPPPRLLSRKSSSTFTLLDRRYLSPSPTPPEPLQELFGWYPAFVFSFVKTLISTLLFLAWNQLFLLGPALWLSVWLWFFWKCVSYPLSIFKWLLTILFTPASELIRKKRTVLISGGSSIQSLHLARNFYTAGARVVVFEVEGHFNLGKYSTSVDSYYTVPAPRGDRAEEYIEAIKAIATKENITFYIPTSVTTTAYYDALLKPNLELLGVSVFCPGLKEVCLLDDVMELLRRCHIEGMSTPEYYPVMCKEEVYRLYDDETLSSGRHIMFSAGPIGCRDRMKVLLPSTKRKFKGPHHISINRPWVIVTDYPGDHFVTCTTVKDSKVIANVTCKVGYNGGKMIPVNHKEIDLWLDQLFTRLKFLRPVCGHMSFRFVECTNSGSVVPLGCRVGVSLPYICHTEVQAKLIWKPCRHFSRQASGPLVSVGGRYWVHEALLALLWRPSLGSAGELVRTMVDRREALFAHWDPLPYLAYYHIQLPLEKVTNLMRRIPQELRLGC